MTQIAYPGLFWTQFHVLRDLFTDLTTGKATVRTFLPRLLTAASRIQNCTYRKIITYQTPQSNLPSDWYEGYGDTRLPSYTWGKIGVISIQNSHSHFINIEWCIFIYIYCRANRFFVTSEAIFSLLVKIIAESPLSCRIIARAANVYCL